MKIKNKIDQREIEIIKAHVLKKTREFLLTHPEQAINKTNKQKITRLINRRKCGIPLAYLTGHKEFFGLDFIVNKHTLIPRPETELLVTEALKHLSAQTPTKTILIDVGTGSGCIPISIIKTKKQKNIKTFAIDISANALTVAKKNAQQHNVKIKFLHGDLLSPISKSAIFKSLNLQSSIIITANLPYLTPQQFKSEPSIQHEPKLALVAKNNGLALYEKLLKQISQISITYNLKPKTYFEIDPSQSKSITKLIKQYLPQASINIKKDLAGLDRIVIIK